MLCTGHRKKTTGRERSCSNEGGMRTSLPVVLAAGRLTSRHISLPSADGRLSTDVSLSSLSSGPAGMDAAAAGDGAGRRRPRILCLHGRSQNGPALSNKISGARRKLVRSYDLDFVDGPIALDGDGDGPRAWWDRAEDGTHVLVEEAFDHVATTVGGDADTYDAILGFSQGGTLAAGLALSGLLPNVRCVVTAGAPCTSAVLEAGRGRRGGTCDGSMSGDAAVPMLHFAGETDDMVPVESTRELCDRAGRRGRLVVHEKGHLFPTRSVYVKEMLDFLESNISNR